MLVVEAGGGFEKQRFEEEEVRRLVCCRLRLSGSLDPLTYRVGAEDSGGGAAAVQR